MIIRAPLRLSTRFRNRLNRTRLVTLDTSALLALCEGYYQRLLQGDQFEAARTAFQLLIKESNNPAVKDSVARRLAQLDMIGKPAPAIVGNGLDGKPVSLADYKGDVILVCFWASWCVPCSTEVAALDQVYSTFHSRGFRVIGINVDAMQADGPKLETVLPNFKISDGSYCPMAKPDQWRGHQQLRSGLRSHRHSVERLNRT